jgi:hypothetical protein
MCDYSLFTYPNRLACGGEQLISYRFPSYSIGLAPLEDVEAAACRAKESRTRFSWWSRLNGSNCRISRREHIPAVCIPPGTSLRVTHMPVEVQWRFGLGSMAEVTFVELSSSAYEYRDAIRFKNGRTVLLQDLGEDVRFRVLCLTTAEPQQHRSGPTRAQNAMTV